VARAHQRRGYLFPKVACFLSLSEGFLMRRFALLMSAVALFIAGSVVGGASIAGAAVAQGQAMS